MPVTGKIIQATKVTIMPAIAKFEIKFISFSFPRSNEKILSQKGQGYNYFIIILEFPAAAMGLSKKNYIFSFIICNKLRLGCSNIRIRERGDINMARFSHLYEQYVGQVHHFLLALTDDSGLAEELTQETFYQAFLHIDQFENRCSVSTWLCQIGKNAYFRELKRRKRTVSIEEAGDQLKNPLPNPEESFLEREQLQRLRAHLAELPEPYRSVITLRVYSGTDYKELARLFGKSESWARVTFFRAKEQLASLLAEEEKGRNQTGSNLVHEACSRPEKAPK